MLRHFKLSPISKSRPVGPGEGRQIDRHDLFRYKDSRLNWPNEPQVNKAWILQVLIKEPHHQYSETLWNTITSSQLGHSLLLCCENTSGQNLLNRLGIMKQRELHTKHDCSVICFRLCQEEALGRSTEWRSSGSLRIHTSFPILSASLEWDKCTKQQDTARGEWLLGETGKPLGFSWV